MPSFDVHSLCQESFWYYWKSFIFKNDSLRKQFQIKKTNKKLQWESRQKALNYPKAKIFYEAFPFVIILTYLR